jgi:hypothetical protein
LSSRSGPANPSCAADHPYGQQLTLHELNGVPVKLTKFLAGGNDYSDRIASWFGSQTLSASGTLNAKLCWQLTSVPVTLNYEMDGVDSSGHAVQATLKVDFKSPLDGKSGGATTGRIPSLTFGVSKQQAASIAARNVEAQRRAQSPKSITIGMVVAPQVISGSAAVPLRNATSAVVEQK